MKILMLSQGLRIEDQPSFDAAFRCAKSNGELIGFRNIPYLGVAKNYGAKALWDRVLRENDEFKPDVVFFQFFQHSDFWGDRAGANPTFCVDALKAAENKPLIFGSVGDLFQPNRFKPWFRIPTRPMMELAKRADAFFLTSLGSVGDYLSINGARNLIFLPHAYANENFSCAIEDVCEKEIDVAMVCSIGISRVRPLGSLIQVSKRWNDARLLYKRYGSRFAVFGRGWSGHPAYRGVLPFHKQVELYKKSRVVVDACAPVNEMYYASDRPFFILGSGSFLVQRYTPRFEQMFQWGKHIEYARNSREVVECCDRLLSLDSEAAAKRREETLDLIRTRHCVKHRVDTIISMAEALIERRTGKISVEDAKSRLRLWHFLPDIDLNEERKYAVRNWVA